LSVAVVNNARKQDAYPEFSLMSVDASTVKRIGRLARIRIEEDEVAGYQEELNAILGFVEQLDEVDVSGIKPMTSVMPMTLRRRDDVIFDGSYADKIVSNAPLSEDNFFMVPKVVE
jgi:aspartyl-tRNA(Asn)/glutamyl-tRNA(Gln) amidotransferase subunit C